jgi:hypothetical protein
MIPTQPTPVNRRGGAVWVGRCAVGHALTGPMRHRPIETRWQTRTAPGRTSFVGPESRFVMNRSGETRVRRGQHRYTPAVHTRPVFADPSGRRRRAMRRIGFVSAAALAICLGAMVVAMAGGPTAPFAKWAAPRAPAAAPHGGTTQIPARGTTSPSPSGLPPGRAPSPSPSAGSAPAPSGRATPSATASDTAAASSISGSPLPTNPAGRTPPGHTKSPRPGSSHGL